MWITYVVDAIRLSKGGLVTVPRSEIPGNVTGPRMGGPTQFALLDETTA
jgi:hypothetical protein